MASSGQRQQASEKKGARPSDDALSSSRGVFFLLLLAAIIKFVDDPAEIPPPPLIVTHLLLAGVIAGTIVIGYILSSFIWGAGYQPVSRKALSRMMEFSQPLAGRAVFDLGSGFGRMVLELAKNQEAEVTGVEVDPLKAWWTMLAIRHAGLQKHTRVLRENLLSTDLSGADVVFVFLWPGIMTKLRQKVLVEMRPGTFVVSYEHRFADWIPEKADETLHVFLYCLPDRGR